MESRRASYGAMWKFGAGGGDCRAGIAALPGLDDDMAQGFGMLLCGILVAPQPSTVITADVKDPEFSPRFSAATITRCRI